MTNPATAPAAFDIPWQQQTFEQMLDLVRSRMTQDPSIWTGVGSRKAPGAAQSTGQAIASAMVGHGYKLRSGAAKGMDQAFQRGVVAAGGQASIYLPVEPFQGQRNGTSRLLETEEGAFARRLVSFLHPNWSAVEAQAARGKDFALKAHTRNIFQVLGPKPLTQPVASQVLIFWAPEKDGVVKGGTSTAVALARALRINTFNLSIPKQLTEVCSRLDVCPF